MRQMKEKKGKINLDKIDFETALAKLEEIVEKLGNGQVDLEEMIDLYEEGMILKDHCSKKLAAAKMKIDVILKKEKDQAD
jgi:exodeoxyribonuclease VII small subunit